VAYAQGSLHRSALTADARTRVLLLASGVAGSVGAAYLALVAIYSRPIADDWTALVATRHLGLWSYVHGNWLTGSGRYTATIVLWVTTRLFGDAAVSVTPLLFVALFCVSVGYLLSQTQRSRHGWPAALAVASVALLVVVSITASAPSLFDSIGWLSGMVVDYAGFAAAAGVAAICTWLVSRDAAPWWSLPLAALAGMWAAGFEELVGAILTLAAVLSFIHLRELGHRRAIPVAGAVGLGSAAGFALNVFSPGSELRASIQHAHISLPAAIHTAAHNLSFVYNDLHDGVLLLAIATGVLMWLLARPALTRRQRLWLLAWTGFLLVVPWLITSALTAWGGSTESDDRSPFRAAFLITGSVALALIVLTIVALSLVPSLSERNRGALLALVLMAGGLLGLAHKAAPILHAERMRAHAVELRSASVRNQLEAGTTAIRLRPAPLLTVYTQAYDLSFAPPSEQRAWIIEFLRSYYEIPAADHVVIARTQPRGYCVPDVAASWVGVRSCQELAADR
jgi:hypothetical protein